MFMLSFLGVNVLELYLTAGRIQHICHASNSRDIDHAGKRGKDCNALLPRGLTGIPRTKGGE